MVGANTFREPALTAKMATTLDHISGGRAILGIGGAWFETEHRGVRARVRERVPGAAPMARRSPPDHARHAPRRAPDRGRSALSRQGRPQRSRRRSRSGCRSSSAVAASRSRSSSSRSYGDANNVGGGLENVKRKEAILVQHCETVGRDPAEIERTTGLGSVIIRDSRDEARRVQKAIFERNGKADLWTDQPVGTPEDVAERIAPFLEIGYRHLIAGFPSPARRGIDDAPRDRGAPAARARVIERSRVTPWRDLATGPRPRRRAAARRRRPAGTPAGARPSLPSGRT